MKYYAIIEGGLVTNVLICEDDYVPANGTEVTEDVFTYAGTQDGTKSLDQVQADAATAKDAADLEQRKKEAREWRDQMLKDTDWWAVSDRTMTQEQIDTRQALRDYPSKEGFPDVPFMDE